MSATNSPFFITDQQTARKTTGGVSPQEFLQQGNPLMPTLLNHESGKPPSSKKGFFNSPSGGSAAQQHSDSHDPVQKRRSEHNTTFLDGQTRSPTQSRKPMSRSNTMKTHRSPQGKVGKDTDQTNRHAADHIRNEFMWTVPTSNIRGDDEEEEDELLSFSLSPGHTPRNTETSPVAKTKTNAITKCDRCRTNGTNPICVPCPGSKKCAKCVRDHRTCSWTSGLSGPSSSFGGNSSLKTGSGKTSSEKRKASDPEPKSVPVKSKINDSTGQAQQIGPKVQQRSISKRDADHILFQCKRCASNASNPICEVSDDPNVTRCKKCRRDKQACSFAQPIANRKNTISAGTAGKGDTDEEDDEEKNSSVETGLKEKKKGAEDDAEKKTELDSEESQTEAAGDENRGKSPKAARKKVRVLFKRKKDANQDDSPSEGDRSSSKKKKRPNTTSLDRTIPSASASNASGSLHVASSNSYHKPHGTSGLPGLHLNETGNTSTPSSTTTPRVISIPSAFQGQVNGRTHPSQHSVSVGSSIVTQPTGQRPGTVVQDRSIAAIERELRAAEVKAASHRAIAESYQKDADRAEEEVLKLKNELLTAVRNNTNLGVEGVAAERKMLIEQLLGSGVDQRA
ncbi:hypothetical protein M378DRAFT_174597 [Amanita muscaria Koide BX008]|uniref:Uncharacterized protein n=1 Tax=Amanita muscaria (strain Koide BX008) TaxID=946122 RepID=A0A0C2XNJ7_AMAMK|nr:hypothetical protein M378DRAFT_174597 [Amanita muscaria Koide BX008]